MVQFYEHFKSSKEVASGPGVAQYEHTPVSRPPVSGKEQFGVEATTSWTPDIKFPSQTSEHESCKIGVSRSAGREESEGQLTPLDTIGTLSTYRATLLAKEPPQVFSGKLYNVFSVLKYTQGFDLGISDSVP